MKLYRITGANKRYNPELRGWELTGDRVTVRRSQKGDLAMYEDLDHAKRGLRGMKANNSYYSDFRIEETETAWTPV